MRISKDEAMAAATATKKLLTVRKGQCWLFAPYMPGASYHAVHWDSLAKQSVQCEEANCRYCPAKANPKVHLPAIVRKQPMRAESAESVKFPDGAHYRADLFSTKIVELTKNCFEALDVPSEPNELAIAWRPGNSQNGPLFFRWLRVILKGVPDDLQFLQVNDILPGVIGGTYRTHQEVTIDNSATGRIKHNQSYQTQLVENAGERGNIVSETLSIDEMFASTDAAKAVPNA